jgi:hypothetical protein
MPFVDELLSKRQIFDYWKNRLDKLGFLSDWGEPGCWACGLHYGSKYDIKHPDASWNEILQCWDRIPLQRCHIVSRALGGKNIAANLFLMCRECHDLAPNTNIREVFFEWARSQSWFVRETSKLRAAYAAFGPDEAFEQDFSELLASREFKSWVSDKYSLHRPQSGYASVVSRLTPATLVGLAVHYRRAHKKRP